MRLPIGQKCRIILEDGTTLIGTVARSWQWGVYRLNGVTFYGRMGQDTAPALSYFLIPRRRVLFTQVGGE